MVSAHRRVLSVHFVLVGKVDTISSYLLEYPCKAVRYLYRPHGVMKVV